MLLISVGMWARILESCPSLCLPPHISHPPVSGPPGMICLGCLEFWAELCWCGLAPFRSSLCCSVQVLSVLSRRVLLRVPLTPSALAGPAWAQLPSIPRASFPSVGVRGIAGLSLAFQERLRLWQCCWAGGEQRAEQAAAL